MVFDNDSTWAFWSLVLGMHCVALGLVWVWQMFKRVTR